MKFFLTVSLHDHISVLLLTHKVGNNNLYLYITGKTDNTLKTGITKKQYIYIYIYPYNICIWYMYINIHSLVQNYEGPALHINPVLHLPHI